jgi:transcription elongation factor Elf1
MPRPSEKRPYFLATAVFHWALDLRYRVYALPGELVFIYVGSGDIFERAVGSHLGAIRALNANAARTKQNQQERLNGAGLDELISAHKHNFRAPSSELSEVRLDPRSSWVAAVHDQPHHIAILRFVYSKKGPITLCIDSVDELKAALLNVPLALGNQVSIDVEAKERNESLMAGDYPDRVAQQTQPAPPGLADTIPDLSSGFPFDIPYSTARSARSDIAHVSLVWQQKIRQLCVLIAYVAVSLAMVRVAVDHLEQQRISDFVWTSIAVPFVLTAVSVLVLRPGPSRDWVTALFWTTGQILFSIMLIRPAIVIMLMNRWPGAPAGQFRVVTIVLTAFLIGGLFLLGNAVRVGRQQLLAMQCPACEKRRLVRAALEKMTSSWRYFRCGICDRQEHVRISRKSQVCPNNHICPYCNRLARLVVRYRFYWCVSCHARFKRLRHGDWEDASKPVDDSHFWLWSVGRSVQTLFGWIVK